MRSPAWKENCLPVNCPKSALAGRHDLTSDPDEPDQRPHHVEIERLEAELTSRDETINLLLEQLRLVEEAESASRVEWEQLTQWVADVEERIERQEGTGPARFDQEVETHRKEAEDCRLQLDLERKTWNDQRRGLENEIERLQTLMARPAQEAATPSDGVSLAILKSENQRLRQLCHDLDATVKSQTRSLREAVEAGRRELEEVRKERDCVQDERDRERREYEIAIAALRSQFIPGSPVRTRATGRRPVPKQPPRYPPRSMRTCESASSASISRKSTVTRPKPATATGSVPGFHGFGLVRGPN